MSQKSLTEMANDVERYIRQHEQAIADYTELATVASMEGNTKMLADLEIRFGHIMEPYRKMRAELNAAGQAYLIRKAQAEGKKKRQANPGELTKAEQFILGEEAADYDKWIQSQRTFDENKPPSKL